MKAVAQAVEELGEKSGDDAADDSHNQRIQQESGFVSGLHPTQ